MNILSVTHETKSNYSYIYNKNTLHLRLRTAKSDINVVSILAIDPFNWLNEPNDEFTLNLATIQKVQMKKDYSTEHFDYWFGEVHGGESLRISYAFVLKKAEKEVIFGPAGYDDYNESTLSNLDSFKNFYNFPYMSDEDSYEAPPWVKDTIWYQIFPERFANSENTQGEFLPWDSTDKVDQTTFFGGNLKGIIDNLDYIQSLGISGIYFTPIFQSPSTHKYDTQDYFNIDKSFGDNEIFRTLVKEAHKRNIKIMLDAVFNHCGYFHPFWQDVLKNGKQSKYYDCFHILKEPIKTFEEDENGVPLPLTNEQRLNLSYRTFAFVPTMPKWNTANKFAREYLLSIAKFWVEEYDIDGWRLDVSNEVSHDFWREFRKIVKNVKPDVYILGENWHNSYPWLMGDQFDAVMNYLFLDAVWTFCGKYKNLKTSLVADYKDRISSLLVAYPKNIAENQFNMIDSHDTSRLLTICGEDPRRAKLAFLLQMTFSGAPSLYYGSELGLKGVDDGNRKCMPWDESRQNLDIKNHVVKLINIRKAVPSTKSVDIEWLDVCHEDVLCFKKSSNSETLYVLINNSDDAVTVDLPKELATETLLDIYNDLYMDNISNLKIEPFGFYMLTK